MGGEEDVKGGKDVENELAFKVGGGAKCHLKEETTFLAPSLSPVIGNKLWMENNRTARIDELPTSKHAHC